MYCCVHNTWVLFIDIFVHVSSLKHTVKMCLSITLNIIEINNIPFFEKYKAIVLSNTIIQLTWGLRWQATFPRHTVVFVLIPPCNHKYLKWFLVTRYLKINCFSTFVLMIKETFIWFYSIQIKHLFQQWPTWSSLAWSLAKCFITSSFKFL